MKVNGGINRMMVLGGKEGLEYEVCVNLMRFEHLLEYKYFRYVLNESGINEVECSRKEGCRCY